MECKTDHITAGDMRVPTRRRPARRTMAQGLVTLGLAVLGAWTLVLLAVDRLMGIGHEKTPPPSTTVSTPTTPWSWLSVPMDWQHPTDEKRVVLAITRLRATTDVDYRGPLIMNPGGPGGSGVFALRDRGEYLQSIVGGNYDIISFDTRGVGASTPRHQCFASPQDEDAWELQEPGLIGTHAGVIPELYARATAYSALCEASMADTGLLEHAGSVAIARDMLEIISQAAPDGLLRYWGFSWGTVLGGIFAAMYPDRVDRLVSDGNVDYREWFRAEHRNFPRDAEKVMDAFYTACHAAGPDACEMHADSPEAVRARLDAVFESLKERPVVVGPGGSGPSIPFVVTHTKLKVLQYSALYQPADQFAPLARIAAALERGDGLPFYEHQNPPPSEDDDNDDEEAAPPSNPLCGAPALTPLDPLPDLVEGNRDAFSAIRCSDYTPAALGDVSIAEVRRQADEILHISPSTGALNALHALVCVGRRTAARWTYDGPLGSVTRHPILFLANTADNITPLVSARNNSAGFPGSVVLVQHGYGHTSLAAPSDCAKAHVRAYFQNGTLPEEGTECDGPWTPFAGRGQSAVRPRTVSAWWL